MAEVEGPIGDESPTSADHGPTWSVFGDSTGLAVFLGALCLAGLTMRTGFFITDSYPVANGVANVARGHLSIERLYYSLSLGSQPGLHVVDGQLYARNYGQIYLALPLFFALEGLTAVAEVHLVLLGAWSLLVLAFCRQVGVVVGRRREFQLAGCLLALVIFGANVGFVESPDGDLLGAVALQLLSVLAFAVTVLAIYRTLARRRGRRVGLAGAGVVALGTPLWFWAPVMKRHVPVAAAVATLTFWFATSRRPGPRASIPVLDVTVSKAVTLRAAGYALAGFVASIHAFEGVLLLSVFAVSDLATAPPPSRRTVAALALAVLVGLLPFLATNLLVAGSVAEPPRLTPSFNETTTEGISIGPGGEILTGAAATGNGTAAGAAGESGSGQTAGTSAGAGETGTVGLTVDLLTKVVDATGTAPDRLYHTYLRSGRIDSIQKDHVNDFEAIELSYTESTPLVGGAVGVLVGWTVAAGRRSAGATRGFGRRICSVRRRARLRPSLRTVRETVRNAPPGRQTDAFAGLVTLGFATMYLPYLPLHSQITVRYLLPTVPLVAYFLVATRTVSETVESAPRTLVWSYLGFTVAGVVAVVAGFPHLGLAVGEAMQLHALTNLAVAAVAALGLASTVALNIENNLGCIDRNRLSAVVFGLGGAVTTVLLLFMQLAYFEYGTYLVPLVRFVADWLTVLS